jgi:hypothetical protein
MTQNVRTYDEAVTGSKQNFFSFSLLFRGIQQTTGGMLAENENSKVNPLY